MSVSSLNAPNDTSLFCKDLTVAGALTTPAITTATQFASTWTQIGNWGVTPPSGVTINAIRVGNLVSCQLLASSFKCPGPGVFDAHFTLPFAPSPFSFNVTELFGTGCLSFPAALTSFQVKGDPNGTVAHLNVATTGSVNCFLFISFMYRL